MSENSSEEPEDLDKEITDNEQSNGILYWCKLRVNPYTTATNNIGQKYNDPYRTSTGTNNIGQD